MKKKYPNIDSCFPIECQARKIMKSERLISNVFRKHLLPYGITNSQFSIMLLISKKKTTTQTEVGNMLALEKSSVSRNMIRLIQDGMIKKESSRELVVTEKGLLITEQLIPVWQKAKDEVRNILGHDGEEALDLIINKLQNFKG